MIALTWPGLPLALPHDKKRTMRDAPAETTDESLVRDTLAGNERAYADLITRHKGRVFGTCSRFARDSQELDELCQEVFVKAWRKLRSFRGDAPFEHWLARITITSCYDFLRRERRYRETVSIDDSIYELRDTGVDAAVSAGRARELLDWAMRQLSADERLILTLLEIEERPVREIAASTGWSESNVKVRAFRARAKLRDIITNCHES
jgi:RNA polymerase sigma-70 factor, ECF subfamily